jgi:glycosyltransferase involved in cell wall biosynthesis
MGLRFMKLIGKKILVVSPDFPFPPNHGGRVDIWNRIKVLKKIGFETDLVVTVKQSPDASEIDYIKSFVNNVALCRRRNRLFDLFSFFPLQIKSRKSLRNVRPGSDYDIILLESEYTYQILSNTNISARVRVGRIHNSERQYFRELCAASGIGIRKLYYFLESIRFGRMERLMSEHVPNLMFISPEEHAGFRNRFPHINSITLPPCVNDDPFSPPRSGKGKVLFLGSLFMVNNQQALNWYIKNVHPLLFDIDGYEFLVVGNSRGQSLRWLHDLRESYGRISIHDSPDDISPFYESASVFVNSMRYGTGVKLKTIEAIRKGLPVVSTTIGNQGTGLIDGEHILIADEPRLFAKHIRSLLFIRDTCQNLVVRAQEYISRHYRQEEILRNFLEPLLEKAAE